jgi:probable HAF family extracellular repeat protein
MRITLRLILAPIGVLLLFGGMASGQIRYELTDLGTLGGDRSEAFDINNDGVVVGWSRMIVGGTDSHAFRYENGVMEALSGFPTTTGSSASGINDLGQIVGSFSLEDSYGTHGFVWSDGVPVDLGDETGAHAINNSGIVVGYYDGPSIPMTACYWDDGVLVDLGVPDGYSQSRARGVNDLGQIVGNPSSASGGGVLWENGSTTLLPGGSQAINEKGECVGGYYLMRLSEDGWEHTTFGVEGAYAFDINETSTVVGRVGGDYLDRWAFLWTEAGGIMDLNDVIAPNTGWVLREARAINDLGQVVGWGENADGETHGFLLSPVPEPATVSLLVLGGVAMLKRRRTL